jgi:hypothetical protein
MPPGGSEQQLAALREVQVRLLLLLLLLHICHLA